MKSFEIQLEPAAPNDRNIYIIILKKISFFNRDLLRRLRYDAIISEL